MRRCQTWQYVRASTGGRVRRCASYRRSSRHRRSASRGAHCVSRQRVYSAALGRYVTRCKRFAGPRLHRPRRAPSRVCTAKKTVYSAFYRRPVVRCASFTRAVQPTLFPDVSAEPMAHAAQTAGSRVFAPPGADVVETFFPTSRTHRSVRPFHTRPTRTTRERMIESYLRGRMRPRTVRFKLPSDVLYP